MSPSYLSYGFAKNSRFEAKQVLDEHDVQLEQSRQTLSWMESISPDYLLAITRIALYSNLHR